jgi:cell division transport system permease protein
MKQLASLLAGALEDGWLSFWRGRWRSLFGTLVLALALLPLGALLVVDQNLKARLHEIEAQVNVTVYAAAGTAPEAAAKLRDALAARPEVLSVAAVSPDEAMTRLKTLAPDLYDLARELRSNPLPWSYELQLRPDSRAADSLDRIKRELGAVPGVAGVDADLDWARALQSVSKGAAAIGYAYALLLALGAVFTIGAVLKMTYLLKRDQVEIMRLVGATRTAVVLPFFLEGALLGLGGGLLALLGLWGGHAWLRHSTSPVLLSAAAFLPQFLSPESAALLFCVAVALGALGGVMTLGSAVQK